MRLKGLSISNYRSIVNSGEIRIEPFQALVGENNSGKSNILLAIQAFLTSGAGGIDEADFFDPAKDIVVNCTFGDLSKTERKALRLYLQGDLLIIEKRISLETDKKSGKVRPSAQYHGYIAQPKDWWLSTDKVIEKTGKPRPNWEEIASENGIIGYVRDEKGKVTKASYEAGIKKILLEKEDIEFDTPKIGETQALGLQPVLLDNLSSFRILPAITDYSDEIDKRASKTNFNLLMGDLSERIIKLDPRYKGIEMALKGIGNLFNTPLEGEEREKGQERLQILDQIEVRLKEIITKLMPSIQGVRLKVEIEAVKDFFSRGVSILVNDGKFTEVEKKGNGLQRCVVFALMQALILNQRGTLVAQAQAAGEPTEKDERTIILAIEEPELYIHPQMQRLIYSVLKSFSISDQVVFSTHSPSFVDISNYDSIAVVRKRSITEGTKVQQCEVGALDADTEQKTFQFLTSFGLQQNTMFFAKQVLLVEGEEDQIAILAAGRNMGFFREYPEELGVTIIVTDSKQEMPKYLKLLNRFEIPYMILHELDGVPDSEENKTIETLSQGKRRIPIQKRLEDVVGHEGHFKKSYHAKVFFKKPENITEELKGIVRRIFEG